MIWEQLAEKKIQRQIKLLHVLRKGPNSLKGLAERLSVSTKSIQRDLVALEKLDLIFFKRGVVIWQNPETYLKKYHELLAESKCFATFCQLLWEKKTNFTRYIYRQLSDKLQPLNIMIVEDHLEGSEAVLFQLRWQYLYDFGCVAHAGELKEKLFDFYAERPQNLAFADLWNDLLGAQQHYEAFLGRTMLPETFALLFYFEEQKRNYNAFLDFYFCHRTKKTELYRQAKVCTKLLQRYLKIQDEMVYSRLNLKMFRLLLEIRQGFPLGYILQLETNPAASKLLFVAKKIKAGMPVFCNCPLEQLAFVLEKVVYDAYLCCLEVDQLFSFFYDDYHYYLGQEKFKQQYCLNV